MCGDGGRCVETQRVALTVPMKRCSVFNLRSYLSTKLVSQFYYKTVDFQRPSSIIGLVEFLLSVLLLQYCCFVNPPTLSPTNVYDSS